MNVSDVEAEDRTDEEWRTILNGWSNSEVLTAYSVLLMHEPTVEGSDNVGHALWCMEGNILERMNNDV